MDLAEKLLKIPERENAGDDLQIAFRFNRFGHLIICLK